MPLSIARAVKDLMILDPFYGLFLMQIEKRFDDSIPTACVARSGIDTVLLVNETFWNGLTDKEEMAVLEHEANHILHGHLTENWSMFPDKTRLNYAMDAEINNYIDNLPKDCIKPEKYNLMPFLGTKYYYEHLPEDIKEPEFDIHDWKDFENLSDAEKTIIKNQIDHIAKTAAEETQKMQGKIPAGLEDYIKNLFKKKERIFDWTKYFRRLIGTAIDVQLRKSRKRESIRFPDASGIKHKKKSNIVVVVDTSGSVSDKELVQFFNEIYYVWSAGTNVTIIENDAAIQRIYQYSGKWDGKVTGRGGTIFTDSVKWINDHRRDYQTAVFFTDGYADVKFKINVPNIWVITSNGSRQQYPGTTLYIPKTNE